MDDMNIYLNKCKRLITGCLVKDNGPMEGFFGTLKSEMFYDKSFETLEELKAKIVKYIRFYNENRFQKKLGCIAPLEYRNHTSISA